MTPTDLKSARKALGLSQRGLAEALGYKGKWCYKEVQRMESGTKPIPIRIGPWVRTLLVVKRIEVDQTLGALHASSEPVSVPHSERLTQPGPAQPPER